MPISPTRKASLTKGRVGTDDLNKVALKNTLAKANSSGAGAVRGKSLVELAQARAGGRPIAVNDGTRSPEPKGRAFAVSAPLFKHYNNRPILTTLKARMAEKANIKDSSSAPVWDPETDEMPSPFIIRSRKNVR